jgi:hypothetical protein
LKNEIKKYEEKGKATSNGFPVFFYLERNQTFHFCSVVDEQQLNRAWMI